MQHPTPLPLELLKQVSRSFYLSLRALPSGMREPIALAYLLARIADTIADTSAIAASERLDMLQEFYAAIEHGSASADTSTHLSVHANATEQRLFKALPDILTLLSKSSHQDKIAIQKVLHTISLGMRFDLEFFPDETSGKVAILNNEEELNRYTYSVAGCVGEFWTELMFSHLTLALDKNNMCQLGIRFGQALQLTNILRDCGSDLRIGRCYLPKTLLDTAGLSVEDLWDGIGRDKFKPVLSSLIHRTLDHFDAAITYVCLLPRDQIRLRLACLWPIIIGLETLLLITSTSQNKQLKLSPSAVSKIRRRDIYRILFASLFRVSSNYAIQNWARRLRSKVELVLTELVH
ncbi:MAG: phytoene/squalene synthase family protein [Undibacterium sp.]|nr:phytoene/squalene synthase family protein [Undibacterium sp.]